MSEPFLAEIRMVGFAFAPKGWAFCDGQVLPINQNQSLYSLLGTTYGGDGRTTFALPDLRGRTPLHPGNGINEGTKGGEENHSLGVNEIPAHQHILQADTGPASRPNPNSAVLSSANNVYHDPGNLTALHSASVGAVGLNQAHNNMQPFLAVNFCIALQGLFPSRN
ncbi:MAG: phage tail protein [Deferribacteres bacterium]|nr:phage tail protein [candidate division KSB1 bacterium]MCB9500670.1 phage tail protein [Deferribacteres bacterium]